MHVRFTTCVGMPVTDDQMEEDIGIISDILLNPDTGVVEGFFVMIPSFLRTETLFLSVIDIVHIGTRVRVRHTEALSPIGDVVRLQPLFDDGRMVLGQRMVTESGRFLGVCRDVQFETLTFRIEWYFPKRFLRWRPAVNVSNILEIQSDLILVRDPIVPAKATSAETVLKTLEPLTGTPLSRKKDY